MEFNELKQRQKQLMLKRAKQTWLDNLPYYNDKAQACLMKMRKFNYKILAYWFNVLQYDYDDLDDAFDSLIEDIADEIVTYRNQEYLIMHYEGE